MGHRPPEAPKVLTLLETAKMTYVLGHYTVEEFEERVAHLIATGSEDYRSPMVAPPNPSKRSTR